MFELKYAITTDDIKAENKKIALFYFLLYFIVAVIGLAVGIVAVVLNPQTSVLVLGIVILVFSALLLAISVLMTIAPKNLVTSAIEPSDDELNVIIDKNGITVDGNNIAAFADITKIKDRKTYIVAYIGKDNVVIVKDKIVSGGAFSELLSYMTERQGKLLLVAPETATDTVSDKAETDGEKE